MIKITSSSSDRIDCIVEWKLDQKSPTFIIGSFNVLSNIKIEADGEELTYILDNITGIPKMSKRCDDPISITWRGESAMFIVDNLLASK